VQSSINPRNVSRPASNVLIVSRADLAVKCKSALENAGLATLICESPEDARRLARTPPPLATVIGLADRPNGVETRAIRELAAAYPMTPIFGILTLPSPASERFVRNFMDRGLLHGAFTQPFELHQLVSAIQRLSGKPATASIIPGNTDRDDDEDMGIIGRSTAIEKIRHAIRKVAQTDVPVLITGESGTGKELAALAIHRQSRRCANPFVAINCAGMPEGLVASELYGHERGAFTGAVTARTGRIEAAKEGSCFLDEIGDLPVDVQGYLLRFLQEKKIERVGSTASKIVDARVIAATHTDLQTAVSEKKFREDLFYRLNIFSIKIPPLRERGDDIELLARHFIQNFAAELNSPVRGLREDALDALQRYNWPGNVRQLIAVLQRVIVMAEGAWISAAELHLPGTAAETAAPPPTLAEARRGAEASSIRYALEATGSNVQRAARTLGISRNTLYRLAERHAITLRDQP
jgi:DNA-binding NtrC family response regulator